MKYPNWLWEKWEWPQACGSWLSLPGGADRPHSNPISIPSSTLFAEELGFANTCRSYGIKLPIVDIHIFWYTYFLLILQVETREIPIKYKAENLQNVGSSNGTNCPESLCNCHPWRNSELVQTRSWAAGSNFEVGPPLSRGLDQTTTAGLFQSTVLWHFAQWLIKIFWRLSKWVQDKEGKCRFFGLFYLYFYKKPSILLPVREDGFE